MMEMARPSTSRPAWAGRQVHDRLAAPAGRHRAAWDTTRSRSRSRPSRRRTSPRRLRATRSWRTGTSATSTGCVRGRQATIAARSTRSEARPELLYGRSRGTGAVTITIRTIAQTFALGRLDFTQALHEHRPDRDRRRIRRVASEHVTEPDPDEDLVRLAVRRGPRRVRHAGRAASGRISTVCACGSWATPRTPMTPRRTRSWSRCASSISSAARRPSRTWLHRIGVNACYDALRRKKRRPMLRSVDPDDGPQRGPRPGRAPTTPTRSWARCGVAAGLGRDRRGLPHRRWCSPTCRTWPTTTSRRSSTCRWAP